MTTALTSTAKSIFPIPTRDYILAFQFSSWYPTFSHISIKSKIIKSLDDSFRNYLLSDGIFLPEGSEDFTPESTLSDDDDEQGDESDDEEAQPRYSFPELDSRIRQAIKEFGAVFPKLNFTSPKDASWILPASSPLKCMSPADIYMLLKSSDFISHDLTPEEVFRDCELEQDARKLDLELVLRKWYPIEPSREARCFVRHEKLVGVSQRDNVFYEFMNDLSTKDGILVSIVRLWETEIKPKFTQNDYVFDVLLTRDLAKGHILDFNPYSPRTDPLLFTYEELDDLSHHDSASLPLLRVIDSSSHPAAIRGAPVYQHNMVPSEVFSLGGGRTLEEFASLWQDELMKTMDD